MRFLPLLLACLLPALARAEPVELLNVSYDPTREFYEEYNAQFAARWKEQTGQVVKIKQSHGGSAKQARGVIEGLKADVVTLALGQDIDAIAKKSTRVAEDWQKRLPHDSTPATSVIVFLVRKGNPKAIHDWPDLIKDGVKVITPNPKTSGGARWNYLAAWGYALQKEKSADGAMNYMRELFRHVPLLDAGARGATTTFAQRGIGDVLIAWESEAMLAKKKMGDSTFEIVYPSISIRAEPPVALVDEVVEKKGTRKVAEAYLKGLYTPEAQQLAAKHFYRPSDANILAQNPQFKTLELFTIATFGGWAKAQAEHFDEGGTFDQIYNPQ